MISSPLQVARATGRSDTNLRTVCFTAVRGIQVHRIGSATVLCADAIPLSYHNRSALEVAAGERKQRTGPHESNIREGIQDQHAPSGLRSPEGPELDDHPRQPRRAAREEIQPGLIKGFERQHPRRRSSERLERR